MVERNASYSYIFDHPNFKVDIIARAFAMVSSPTVIIPCILIMIMMIYYLKTTNEGKTYALSELKNNLMSEREDFKKRMAQKAAKDDRESGRKSQLQRSRNANGSQIRRGSYDKIISSRRPSLSFQPSLAPSVGGNYK